MANDSRELVYVNKAKTAIMQAQSIDELKDIRDKAEAVRQYHKVAGASLQTVNGAAEIKLRAERRIGGLLKEMPPARPGPKIDRSHDVTELSSLDDLGITKNESSRCQRLDDIPREKFEEHLETTKADGELTTAGTLRFGRKCKRDEEKEQPDSDVPMPGGVYPTIVIDPPWPMQKVDREVRPNQAEFGYKTQTLDQIGDIDIPSAEDANIFVWTTQKFLPATFGILSQWDFRYIFTMVWHKAGGFQPHNLPQYNCEFVLFGRCGSGIPFTTTKAFPTCFDGKRREHSQKPNEFYELVSRVSPGPRIDMYSREKRDGFDQWGDETGKL